LRKVLKYLFLGELAVSPKQLQVEIPLVLFTDSRNKRALIDIFDRETA
jgi:hypothetical protein